MENEALANEMVAALQQLLQAAGPEWTLQFLQAGLQQVNSGEGQQMPSPEMSTVQGLGAKMKMGV